MNRIIKFRAWDKTRKEMYPPFDIFNFVFLLQSEIRKSRTDREFEMMQFTGLTDRNGKEIWEEDIVKNERGEIGVVKYVNGGFVSEYIKPYNWDSMELVDGLLDRQTTIGNIYENPELLTSKDK